MSAIPSEKLEPPRVGATLQDLRQSTEEFNVALSDMAALQERIKLLQEEIAARVAEANNRSHRFEPLDGRPLLEVNDPSTNRSFQKFPDTTIQTTCLWRHICH